MEPDNQARRCRTCGTELKPRTQDADLGMCRECLYLTEPAIASRYFDEHDYPNQSAAAHYRLEEFLHAFEQSPTDAEAIRKCVNGDRFLQYALVTHDLATEPVFEALLAKKTLSRDIRDVAAKRLAGEAWAKWGGLTTGERPATVEPVPDSIYRSPKSERPSVKKQPVWSQSEPDWPRLNDVPMTFVEQVDVPKVEFPKSSAFETQSLGPGTIYIFHVHELVSTWSEYQQKQCQGLRPYYGLLWIDTNGSALSLLAQAWEEDSDQTRYYRDLSYASEQEIRRNSDLRREEWPDDLLDAHRRFGNNLNQCLKEFKAAECDAFHDMLFREYLEAGSPRRVKAWISERITGLFRCVTQFPKWKLSRHWLYLDTAPMVFIHQFRLTKENHYIFAGPTMNGLEFKVLVD